MDYCSSCRRTLNGALVCPGCGAYAPDIAPPATTSLSSFPSSSAPSAHAPASAAPSFFGVSPAADRGHGAGSAGASGAYAASGSAGPFDDFDPFSAAKAFDVAGPGDDAAGSVDVPAPVAASQGGRAARRRKLAQWKKNKRRAVAATAVAIVGGGLTMAALPNDASPDRTHASAAPGPVTTSPALANTDVATDTPDDRASRSGSDRSHKSTGPRHARPANTPTPAASTAPTGAPRHAAPARSATPHTDSAPAAAAHTDSPAAPAPQTSSPASAGQSGGSTGTGSGSGTGTGSGSSGGNQATTPAPAPSTASPEPVCVLGLLCIS
ncbi:MULTISPECIES: hypothetical protein [unclassified Streptomyces]|uniref:SCO2400 family protein n=1 Tax=unclassified Streptomyces TaxID=2593676 RepID=UPI0022516B30|nr:hypothetical protein [Streptomyces sp. NBC_00401]MCX5082981.1 hypothetical protein [Streptomyces sp. NBC_00401]